MLGHRTSPTAALIAAGATTALAMALAMALAIVSAITPAAAHAAPMRWATIDKTRQGYLYTAGLQDSHLVVTQAGGRLRFVDTGTAELRKVPDQCRRVKARVGIAAVCKVPGRVSARRPMKLELVPRLGDDHIDTTRLSAAFDVSVLADAGKDVVRLGAGDDFVNGAVDRDRVSGGAGGDWIRTGRGNDLIQGGPGRDRLVGTSGRDTIYGGPGDDRVGGGDDDDLLYAERGVDRVLCGNGTDDAYVDRSDSTLECESVHYD